MIGKFCPLGLYWRPGACFQTWKPCCVLGLCLNKRPFSGMSKALVVSGDLSFLGSAPLLGKLCW